MESKVVCLDTSVLIDYFRKTKKEQSFFYQLSQTTNSFAVTSITTFEIYNGCKDDQLFFWEGIFDSMDILVFDESASQLASQFFKQLSKKNKLVELPDIFIAAIAINNRLPLATLNVKHFERFDELNIIHPGRQ